MSDAIIRAYVLSVFPKFPSALTLHSLTRGEKSHYYILHQQFTHQLGPSDVTVCDKCALQCKCEMLRLRDVVR